jgi:multidrug transporter EmrE-like cation transporter
VPPELGPLRERNFRLLAGARTISFFGTNLAPVAVAFAVLDLTGSATDVGISFACWTLAQISTLLIGGVVTGEAIGALAGGLLGLRLRPRLRLEPIDVDETELAPAIAAS